MGSNMKENFYNENIAQYFWGCTHYFLPPNGKNLKLFESLEFDDKNKKKLY